MENQLTRGDVIADRYELQELLGVGATGEVYRASDRLLGNAAVAVKILFRSLVASESAVARFRNEAAITRELTHPGIVQIFDFGQAADGSYFLVMELVEGGTLRELIQSKPDGVGSEVALTILTQLADAIGVAHRFGVVHRDLKPENVLIDSAGRARISDFGVAVDPGGVSGLTASGDIVGTVDYMAPEQLAGGEVDARADVFALGLIICELLTGALPWDKSSDIVVNRFSRRKLVMQGATGDLPLPLLNIIDRALEVDLRRRWADGEALSEALHAWRDDSKVGWVKRFVQSRVRVARMRRVLRKAAIVGGVFFLIAAAVAIFDRERLLRTTMLMLFERATGVSTQVLTEFLGVHAEYSEAGMLRCTSEGNHTCIRALLYAGINPNIVDAEGTPLINIMSRQQLSHFAVETLVPFGADINSVDKKGRTPLMTLASSPGGSTRELIARVLDWNPDLLRRDWRGRTVLWYVAALGRIDLWELVIKRFRARYGDAVLTEEINRRDVDGLPLIHIVVGVGARGAPLGYFERFIQSVKGHIDLNAVGPDGLTPLMRTRYLPWQQIVPRQNELVGAGADPELVVNGRKLSPLPSVPNPQLEKEGWDFVRRESDSLSAY